MFPVFSRSAMGELIPQWKPEEFVQIGKVWEEALDVRFHI